ncbi:MAG TPA: hypothetical protein VJV75_13125 [Candidatus Polarisedimenticolia bacterium]|nr:hypothetical protein [Candidatus Polarisedimenticolia bacterium]
MRRTRVLDVVCIGVLLAGSAQVGAAGDATSGTAGVPELSLSGVACVDSLTPGDYVRPVPGWPNRDYLLHVPLTYDCRVPAPVILALHGGGANKEIMRTLTCPDGDLDNPACLDHLADREGFIVVYPDGTESSIARTFNATGIGPAAGGAVPTGEYACVSGLACETDVDDLAYFNDLLDSLETVVSVDASRVFATGISNGAAMAHRLGCEMSNRIAAIAPVAGGNQFSVFQACAPARGVPVVEFHGTADPSWGYGTETTDLNLNGDGLVLSVPRTIGGWLDRNVCSRIPIRENLPDLNRTDGSTVTRFRYPICKARAEVVLYRVNGGGHMWPGGYDWDTLFERYGPTNRDINTNTIMWEFFKAHPIPAGAWTPSSLR